MQIFLYHVLWGGKNKDNKRAGKILIMLKIQFPLQLQSHLYTLLLPRVLDGSVCKCSTRYFWKHGLILLTL